MLDIEEKNDMDVRAICRELQAICHKYPFTARERATLEHLWAEVEDKWLDEELQELEHLEMREA